MISEIVSDFSWKNGDLGDAFLRLSKAIVSFIIMPLCACALLTGIGEAMIRSGSSFMEPEQIRSLSDDFWYYTRRFISLAGPLVLVSIPLGFYRKGSFAKIPFSLFSSLYLALLFLMFLHGGGMTGSLDVGETIEYITIESIRLTLYVSAIVYIAVTISVASSFLAFAEFAANRKEYLEWLDERDNPKDGKEAAA